jgi:hypothetical protein
MRWAVPVARVGKGRSAYRILVEKEGGRLEDIGVDGRTIFNWTSNESVGSACVGLIWLRIGINGGLL